MNRNLPNPGGGGFSNVNYFQGARNNATTNSFSTQNQNTSGQMKAFANNGLNSSRNNSKLHNKGQRNNGNTGNQNRSRFNQGTEQGGRMPARPPRGPAKQSDRNNDGLSTNRIGINGCTGKNRSRSNGSGSGTITSKPARANIKRKPDSTQMSNNSFTSSNKSQEKSAVDISTSSNLKLMDSSNFEVKYFGTLFDNPETLGFQKLNHKPQKIPRYMLQKHVLFDMKTYHPNQWDLENQKMMLQTESEYAGEPQLLFEEFQQYRQKEREKMERLNLVDKENAKKSLDDAIVFRGSCEDMCPTFERVERVFKNQVSKWEKDPHTGKISRFHAMKTFIRPSGQAPSLPSDVRRPDVLQKTLSYLIENLLPMLPDSQSFIWDRTRSIRQDFTFQNNYSGIESIDCHEKICRIHILSLHVMSGANDPDYQQQQELEQFNNSLQTLTHMYNDVRSRGGSCPNEPEFRAYELISKMKDSELDRHLQTLPDHIQNDHIVQRAVMLRSLVMEGMNSVNFYFEFFKAVLDKTKTHFLLACLAETHFNEIRYFSLRSLGRAYHAKSKKMPSAEELVNWLGYNDLEQLFATCKIYQLPIIEDSEMGIRRVDVTAMKSAFKLTQKQAYTKAIDNMIDGRSMSQIVNGGHENISLNLKTRQSVEEIARESFKAGKKNSERANNIFHSTTSKHLLDMPVWENNTLLQSKESNIMSVDTQTSTAFKPLEFQTQATNTSNGAAPFSFGGFSGDSKTSNDSNMVPNLSFTPGRPDFSNGNSGTQIQTLKFPSDVSSPNPAYVPSKKEEEVEKPVLPPSPPPKKLVENPHFKSQAMRVVEDMATRAAVKLSNSIIRDQVERQVSSREKEKKLKEIKCISEELLDAFLRERIYLTVLEAKAIAWNHKNIKKKVIRKIIATSKKSLAKKKSHDDRMKEIERFGNIASVISKIPPPTPHPKQPASPAMLWKMSENCIADTFKRVGPTSDLNGTVITRSISSIPSEWLLNQLGMNEHNQTTKVTLTSGLNLRISVLPDDFDAKAYFKTISTAIIQVGTLEGMDKCDKQTLINCLKKDSLVIKKVKEYLERFSEASNFSVIVVFADSFNHGFPASRILEILKLKEISSGKFTVGMFKLNLPSIRGGGNLASLNKMASKFSKIMETVWKKMYLKKDSSMISTDSINLLTDATGTSRRNSSLSVCFGISHSELLKQNDSQMMPSSLLIKRKIKYLNKVLDGSHVKKQKLLNNCSHLNSLNQNYVSGLDTNSSFPTANDSEAQSLMLLLNNTEVTFDNNSEKPIDFKKKRKLEELKELEQLANSILKE